MANLAKIQPLPQDAPPSLWAPTAGATMDTAPPDMGVTPAPMVSRIPTQGEKNIAHDQARLEKVQWNQEHPWGTPENHPGKLGKIAHVFSTLGNIAGNIVAPGVMANIPQTQLGMKTEEGQLAKRVGAEQTAETENQEREALTNKANTETGLEPGKAASTEALQGAQTENLEHPKTNLQHLETDQGIFAFNPATKELTPLTYQGEPLNPIAKQVNDNASKTIDILGPDHKEHMMGWNPQTKKFDVDMGLKGEKPTQAPGITMVIPNAEGGGGTVQRLTAGSQVAPGAMSGTQFGSLNVPTTQQRNVAAQASLVTEQMPGLINEIRQNAALLGPVSGRWNEFMQGKTGVDNPAMAGLRSDLLMMSSAVALMHARGRLPENLREEFDRSINAPKQTPENLIATLQHIDQWTKANMHAMGAGQGGGQQPANEPPVKKFNPATGRLE